MDRSPGIAAIQGGPVTIKEKVYIGLGIDSRYCFDVISHSEITSGHESHLAAATSDYQGRGRHGQMSWAPVINGEIQILFPTSYVSVEDAKIEVCRWARIKIPYDNFPGRFIHVNQSSGTAPQNISVMLRK